MTTKKETRTARKSAESGSSRGTRPPEPEVIVIKSGPSAGLIAVFVASVIGAVLLALLVNRLLGGGGGTTADSSSSAPSPAKVPAAWTEVGRIQGEIQTIAFDPSNPAKQYLGTAEQGVARSLDGGKTWGSIGLAGETVLDMSVNPTDGNEIIAATMNGFRVSRDGGVTWKSPGSLPSGEYHVSQFDPGNPDVIWAGRWVSREGAPKGDTLFLSRDGGKSWKPAEVAVQGSDVNFVYAAKIARDTYASAFGKGLFRTSDGGRKWEALNAGLPIQSDVTMIAFSSDRSVMYAGTHDYGVYRSLDGGRSWQPANAGKEQASDVHGLVTDPSDPDTVYAAGMMMGRGVFVSKDKGASWRPLETGSINLEDVHVFSLTPDGKQLVMGAGEHGQGFGVIYRMALER